LITPRSYLLHELRAGERHTRAPACVALCGCAGALAALLLSPLFVQRDLSAASVAAVTVSLPDFASLDTAQRKREFSAYLRPIVAAANSRVEAERAFVLENAARLAEGKRLSPSVRARIATLAERYAVEPEANVPIEQVLAQLMERIDTVPASLVLVQAAKESGWGTSRFAVEGNNLFGQRCYEAGCGLAPKGRSAPSFSIKTFTSVEDSVTGYLHNLNTHARYAEFRRVRSEQRAKGLPLDSLELAETLTAYSEQRSAYVSDIKAMIAQIEVAPPHGG
jgi:Bax protein